MHKREKSAEAAENTDVSSRRFLFAEERGYERDGSNRGSWAGPSTI